MALPARRTPAPLVPSVSKQVALRNALEVLNSGEALDRPDTPDEVVTAVRRVVSPFTDGPFIACLTTIFLLDYISLMFLSLIHI